MITLSKKEKVVFLRVFRQTVYFLLVFSFIFFIHFLAHIYKSLTFDEHQIVENLQLIFLSLAALFFVTEAFFYKKYRTVLLLLASLCFFASFRELDKFFDRTNLFLSWKIAYLFPISAVIYAKINFKNLRNTLIDFYSSPAFFMMCCAMIIILPIAQCIGHGPFVRDVLGDFRSSDIKEFFEESCETMGYFVILLSSIEIYYSLLKKK